MRTAIACAGSLVMGILAATYGRRHFGALLWWLFTTDIRAER